MDSGDKKITFRVTDEFYDLVVQNARSQGIAISDFIRMATSVAIENVRSSRQSGSQNVDSYENQIAEMERQWELDKLNMEIRLQTLRAEKAECQVELERVKAENARLKMEAVYQDVREYAEGRKSAVERAKSQKDNQSSEQEYDVFSVDYSVDTARMR